MQYLLNEAFQQIHTMHGISLCLEPTDDFIHVHVPILTGAMMGMMDAYEFDYDRMDGFIEELRDRVGSPPQVNLTELADRGKVSTTLKH